MQIVSQRASETGVSGCVSAGRKQFITGPLQSLDFPPTLLPLHTYSNRSQIGEFIDHDIDLCLDNSM